MSKIFILLLPVCLAFSLTAQDRYDYAWLLGYPPSWPAQKYGGSLLRFSDNEAVRVSYSEIGLELIPMGEICDQKGKLQFYANGCAIYNAQHAQMENGDSLNAPYATRYEWQTHSCLRGLGYDELLSGLIPLPLPGSDHEYVLFHLRSDKVPDPRFPLYATQSLLYSRVDMSANNGLGRVTQKNVLMLRDTFCDHLTAVRHGNGRDWWLVAQKVAKDTAFLFLLTPDGIKGPFPRKIGVEWPTASPFYMGGQAVFAPKGDLYARVNMLNGVHLYRFDRCGGVFFDPKIIPFPDTAVFAPGLAFSPNGRWLYFGTGDKLFQYDCVAQDIAASKTLIGVFDGFTGPPPALAASFHQMRLAPDGKIYMSAANGVAYLHIIHNPDGRASHCNFEQHGLELPTYNGFCLPNFPSFRLYGLEGGPCDTLMSVATQMARLEQNGLTPFPNPADQWVTVRLPAPLASSGRLLVHSSTGALVHETMLSPDDGPPSFDVSAWPSGLYLITHETSWRTQSVKLVVWHAAD